MSNYSQSGYSSEYKIPYDDRSQLIAEHIQQSQEELHFLKIKLTEAYCKLEAEITCNTELENINHTLVNKVQYFISALEMQKKENNKIKEVLQKILQNRKIIERQLQTINSDCQKKLKAKNQEINQIFIEKENDIQRLKHQHQLQIEEIYDTQKKEIRSHTRQLETKYLSKIQILQAQIQKLNNQKVAQISRLRHQIQCYQSQVKVPPHFQQKLEQNRERFRAKNKRFKSYRTNETQEFVQSADKFSRQHQNTLEQIKEEFIEKQNKNINKESLISKVPELNDDQQLTQYQIERKKIQSELTKLQRIKRPTHEERDKIKTLQRQLYELDSSIAGLKRKIRQKY